MTGSGSGRIVAVNHVGISVRDLAAARTFWIDGLGAADHGGFSWPVGTAPADESLATTDTSAAVALLRTDTAFLELFAFASPTPAERPAGSPGVCELTWSVPDVAAALTAAVRAGGTAAGPEQVQCPDGTVVRLVAQDGVGLVGVRVQVADPGGWALPDPPGPVRLTVTDGATRPPAAAVDLGVNHVCLDVTEIGELRAGLATSVGWHHDVTESSGGIAAVCYGTTHDGVIVELLESRSPEAFLSRGRLARP